MQLKKQPWLYSPGVDGGFILFPAFGTALAVLLFHEWFGSAEVSPLAWLLLVVGVDVAHVYSTLYRTYFDREEFRRYRGPLIWLPLAGLTGGVALYWIDPIWFWRILAYLAVYHFVRQQYGFFALYRRNDSSQKWERKLEEVLIYLSTLYTIIYWHTHPRSFNWFVENDFFSLQVPWVADLTGMLYLALWIAYLGKEAMNFHKKGFFNLPKNLILFGTALSWYVGIVLFNGDLTFTLTNVVAHGIPYMALIWIYGRKKDKNAELPKKSRNIGKFFKPAMLPIFVGLLLLFGYFEEGLWDGLVWRDHQGLFPWAQGLPWLREHSILALVVPLLTLPQLTHYLIDGFIWRVRKSASEIREVVFEEGKNP